MKQILHVTVAAELGYGKDDLNDLKALFVEAAEQGGVLVTEAGITATVLTLHEEKAKVELCSDDDEEIEQDEEEE